MIHRHFTFALAAATIAATAGCTHTSHRLYPPANPTVVSHSTNVADANTDFTFRLLHQLVPKAPGQNVFVSPYSITNALSVLMNGAEGETQSQIETALGLGSTPIGDVNTANRLLLPSLCSPDPKVKVSIATALWGARPYPTAFKDTVTSDYFADAHVINFGDSDGAAKTINDWVSSKTKGKIDQIVSPDNLGGATSVITNAVYFHGEWMAPFDKSMTRPGPFHRENAADTMLPLMYSSEEHPALMYGETKTFQALALPYGAGRMSMYIVLPKTGVKLADVVNNLDADSWKKTVAGMSNTSVSYSMPRFHIDYRGDLTGTLHDMGIKAAIDGPGEFRPMGDPGPVSAVLHKAVLDVDETGTTAAAATGVVQTLSAVMYMNTVRVDHPFFCAIRDNKTGTILFAGAIYDPEAIN